ncbi:MAG: ArdC-like ssDNA-binding domain-containing protein [Acidimicrobiales bacterium]
MDREPPTSRCGPGSEPARAAGAARAELLDRLTAGVGRLTTSERWREWLVVQSRFHHYSFANTVLILAQRPDATRVAGYGGWRRLERFVRRGERGIRILAPVVSRVLATAPDDPEPVGTDPGGTEPAVAGRGPLRVLRGFRPVTVFDVAQTDGRPLPEVCRRLVGEGGAGDFERLVEVGRTLGFSVSVGTDLPEGVNGDCSHRHRRIRLLATNTGAQRVKTLAHELGHAVLHAEAPDRALAELEAESVAFVVCAAAGLPTGRYSFGYVATWAGGGDEAVAAIRASGARIQQAADRILAGLEPEELHGVGH